MRVMQVVEGGVVAAEMPQPTAGPGQVRVRAAGVTPTELGWWPTTHTRDGGERREAVPCHEFAGEIAAVGAGVQGFAVGDPIYGMNDWNEEGALAEFCVAEVRDVAPKPERLSFAEAAAVPISALTAREGLLDRLRLHGGERLLIQGGAGAVGAFAVQMGKQAGANVVATAAARDAGFVRGLGADEVIDYASAQFEERMAPVDAVFDAVGGETLERSWRVLRPGGRLVTIVGEKETAATERDRAAFFIVARNGNRLREIARLLDEGSLHVFVKAVAPWERASEVFVAGFAGGTEAHGKIVVEV